MSIQQDIKLNTDHEFIEHSDSKEWVCYLPDRLIVIHRHHRNMPDAIAESVKYSIEFNTGPYGPISPDLILLTADQVNDLLNHHMI